MLLLLNTPVKHAVSKNSMGHNGSFHKLGPLMTWLEAQLKFAEILDEHSPLLGQLKALKEQHAILVKQIEKPQKPPNVPKQPSFVLSRLGGNYNTLYCVLICDLIFVPRNFWCSYGRVCICVYFIKRKATSFFK
jgi:hypothetical protein